MYPPHIFPKYMVQIKAIWIFSSSHLFIITPYSPDFSNPISKYVLSIW